MFAPGTRILIALACIALLTPGWAFNGEAWVWSGAITESSAVVKAKIGSTVAEARLIVADNEELRDARALPEDGPAASDGNGILAFEVSRLASGTLHHYAVEVEGERLLRGRFRTFEVGRPMSFQAVFGSCAKTGSDEEIFDTMRRLDPLFILHMGDLHYENIRRNDRAKFGKAFDRVLTSKRQASLYRHAPIAYVWDDHDYGSNNSDKTSRSRLAALATYDQYVPHYPLVRQDGRVSTIQQAFTAGRLRFIMTDVRAQRDPHKDTPVTRSMLGVEQREWLFRELGSAKAARERYALVVWVNVVPWITKNDEKTDDGWAPYHYERTLIADRIRKLGLDNRLLVLSGDAHMVAIDNGTNSNYASDGGDEPAFPVVHAAPFDKPGTNKGGPYSHGTTEKTGWLSSKQQFGLMRVEDDGDTLEVKLSGHDENGTVRLGPNGRQMILKLRCGASGCNTY